MTENLKNFLSKISSDSELRKQLDEINRKYPDKKANKPEFIKFAASIGVTLTEADFEEGKNKELSLDELSAVTGGTYSKKKEGLLGSVCECMIGGGGSSDAYQKTCACVLGGCGELTDYGKNLVSRDEIGYIGCKSAPVAMACCISGAGWAKD